MSENDGVFVCSYCNNIGTDLKRCGRCKSTNYCNVTCQKNDWPNHKTKCKPVDEVPAPPPKSSLSSYIWGAVGVSTVVALVGSIAYFMMKDKKDKSN